jgi:23S rRNA (pseudouridine1915-N3)-methyltransferase
MRSTLVAVGKFRPGPARDLFDLYVRRLTPPPALVEVEEKRVMSDAQRREREADLLLAATPRGATIVLLDEHGASLTSEAFAAKLALWRDAGIADLAFLIGGAAGHGGAARQRADFSLSLGPMTWPHLLVRGMVAEQLYRGFSILAGHPYHRE